MEKRDQAGFDHVADSTGPGTWKSRVRSSRVEVMGLTSGLQKSQSTYKKSGLYEVLSRNWEVDSALSANARTQVFCCPKWVGYSSAPVLKCGQQLMGAHS